MSAAYYHRANHELIYCPCYPARKAGKSQRCRQEKKKGHVSAQHTTVTVQRFRCRGKIESKGKGVEIIPLSS